MNSCIQCGLVFSTYNRYEIHLRSTHGVAPAPPKNLVGCVVCGAAFKDQAAMMGHIVTHATDGMSSKTQLIEILDKHLDEAIAAVTAKTPYVIEEEPG